MFKALPKLQVADFNTMTLFRLSFKCSNSLNLSFIWGPLTSILLTSWQSLPNIRAKRLRPDLPRSRSSSISHWHFPRSCSYLLRICTSHVSWWYLRVCWASVIWRWWWGACMMGPLCCRWRDRLRRDWAKWETSVKLRKLDFNFWDFLNSVSALTTKDWMIWHLFELTISFKLIYGGLII